MSKPIAAVRYPFAVDAGLGRLAQETDYPAHVEQLCSSGSRAYLWTP